MPYVIVGNIADLPSPSTVAQCTLFHAVDTGDCLVLVIDSATGVRFWQEFCGATGMTGIEGPALLKWAGGGDSSTAPFVIADESGSTHVISAGILPSYPLFRARTGMNFMINLRNNATTSNLVTVRLLVNGIFTLSHTFGPVLSGKFNVPGPVDIPANSTLDVDVISSGFSGNISVSATLELF